jgi:hypothetical protein
MIVLFGLSFLREAIRGRSSVLVRDERSIYERFVVRAGAWMFGLSWPLFVLWALDIVEFD